MKCFDEVVPSGAGSCAAATPDIDNGTGFFFDLILNDPMNLFFHHLLTKVPLTPAILTKPLLDSPGQQKGASKPAELFKAQQESSLTPTTPVSACARLSNSDEASPAVRAAPGHAVATGAGAAMENPG